MGEQLYIGVDVGTGSARAGVFDSTGAMRGSGSRQIQIWKPQADFVQQSSRDIWRAVCEAVRAALADASAAPEHVKGIGFDATCSLVVLDGDDAPVAVGPSGSDEQNVIVWMDHRAVAQAQRINHTGHEVLKYVGGKISPEMQTPKLLWLKENAPDTWRRAGRFLDLPDFLVYRATGRDVRSLCSTVCKWTYLGHEAATINGSVGRWDDSYFRSIGLEDLAAEQYARIGQLVRPMGEPVGEGLSPQAADELGLEPHAAVAVSIIDAHAGGLGLLGAALDGEPPTAEKMHTRLALIGGTSSCHMAVAAEPRFVPGIWGPYFSAMIPGFWLTEGGQSATGSLIDHVIFSHARGAELAQQAKADRTTVYDLLNEHLDRLAERAPFPAALTRRLHVLPYHHGNRSPRADPTLRGMVSGLSLSDSVDELALLYLATIQAIALGTRHIIDQMNAKGFDIRTIFACGGGTKNRVFLREHADATGCRIVLGAESEAVLLGSAILAAVAAGQFESVLAAMGAMNRAGQQLRPAGGEVARYHQAKYAIFARMYEHQMEYRQMMNGAAQAQKAP